jgi:hypothetical protein
MGIGIKGATKAGATLPALTNPATASKILKDYEAIDGSGSVLTGTYVESGGEEYNIGGILFCSVNVIDTEIITLETNEV